MSIRRYLTFILSLSGILSYWLIYLLTRLLILTVVTYVLMFSQSKLQDISEALVSTEIIIMGLSALAFWFLQSSFLPHQQPLSGRALPPFGTGILYGAEIALALCFGFWWAGYYQPSGLYVPTEDVLLTVTGVVIRAVALGSTAIIEELLFRRQLFARLSSESLRLPPLLVVLIASALGCVTRQIQFDLGTMQQATLFLLYTLCGLWTLREGNPWRGAGFMVAIQIVMHSILGLPIFGIESNGIALFRYAGSEIPFNPDPRGTLLVSGGIAGPLGSAALQAILLFFVMRLLWVQRRDLYRVPRPELRTQLQSPS